jgi:hypothetical protein
MTYFNVVCQNFLGGPEENRVAGNPVSQPPVIKWKQQNNIKLHINKPWRKVLYNILIEFGVSMKLVRPLNICLNATYSKVV